MQAITFNQNGGIETLTWKELAIPVPGPEEVLIKIKALSINPVDAHIRENAQLMEMVTKRAVGEEVIPGWDISGEVVAIGEQVTTFKKGDNVFGMINLPGHGQAYAEYVTAPVAHLALKPNNVGHESAAAATLAALTAWQALFDNAQVKAGDKVLIHSAAGGVGHYAVQLAKSAGAFVYGTGSTRNRELILSLGADVFIDHTKERFEEIVKDADVVVDGIYDLSGAHLLRSVAALKPGGRIVSLIAFFEGAVAEAVAAKNVTARRMIVNSDGAAQGEIAKRLGNGTLRSYVSEVFPFKELIKAHQQVEGGKNRGKVIVTI